MSTERMRVGEFADAAGVSPRTVRYYVVEGLLPPPEGAGMGASYGPGHLDRLRLILRLKDAYLPLREIRRQLTGLTDEEVRQRLREMDRTEARSRGRAAADSPDEPARAERRSPGSASDYLLRIGEDQPPAPTEPAALPGPENVRWGCRAPLDPSSSVDAFITQEPGPAADDRPGVIPDAPAAPLRVGRAVPAAAPPEPPFAPDRDDADREPTAEHWVRLKLSDDAELLIRSGAYHRLRDKVDWLVGWARAIFR